MNSKSLIWITVALLLIVGGVVMYQSQNKSSSSSSDGITQVDPSLETITVEGTEFSFSPSTITLTEGKKVRLVFKNTGKMPHDWVVDELNAKTKVIKGGESDTIEFTPTKKGTFEFYCSVGNHRAQGMKGTVVVQ